MQHEESKKGKLKTKVLASLSESDVFKWQRDNREIEEIKRWINNYEIDEYTLTQGVVMTHDRKIWIPANNIFQFIQYIHSMLCHAGIEKVFNYIKGTYAMENFKEKVKEIIETCEVC